MDDLPSSSLVEPLLNFGYSPIIFYSKLFLLGLTIFKQGQLPYKIIKNQEKFIIITAEEYDQLYTAHLDELELSPVIGADVSILLNFSLGLLITDVGNFIIAMHKYISDLDIFKQFSYGLFKPELLITPKIMKAILARQNTVGDWDLADLVEKLRDNSQLITQILLMNSSEISLEEIYLTNNLPENITLADYFLVWQQIFNAILPTNYFESSLCL